jgi:signal transduction histidine kinase
MGTIAGRSAAGPAHRRTLLVLALAGLAAGLVYLAIVLASDQVDSRGFAAGLGLLVGWSFIGTGLFAWWRRPGNRTGALMAAVGFAWFAAGLADANDDVVHTLGLAVDSLFPAIMGHLVLAFPTGRLRTPLERSVITAGYLVSTVLQVPSLLFEDDPRNLLVIESDQPLSDLLDGVQFAAAVVVIGTSLLILARRWRGATPPQRRALAPVLWSGGAAFVTFAIAAGFDAAGAPQDFLERLSEAMLVTVPFGFLAGLLRSRLAQASAMSGLVARLGQAPDPSALRAALSEELGDPSLAVAYWLPDSERFVDAGGRPLALPDEGWTEVQLHGRRIAAIVHDPTLADEPQLVRAAGAAAALALENQRLAAELRARIEELRASRARIVEAGDAERRRLERDLHDGAQSRLVALAVKLRLAHSKAQAQPELAQLLDESAAELKASLDELRELARGIHPAVLTDRGLGAALEALANRTPVPVELAADPPAELPDAAATAVYFVVSEALTNVAKYAHAGRATVAVRGDGDKIVVDVTDDGVGGAELAGGSGLRGLADRLAALDGQLELHSPTGQGTHLHAEIPLERTEGLAG